MFYGPRNLRSDGKAYVHHIPGVVCVGECGHASDEFGGEMDTSAGYRRSASVNVLAFFAGGSDDMLRC